MRCSSPLLPERRASKIALDDEVVFDVFEFVFDVFEFVLELVFQLEVGDEDEVEVEGESESSGPSARSSPSGVNPALEIPTKNRCPSASTTAIHWPFPTD